MGGSWRTRLRRILYRDLVTGYTIPREGRVDPTPFPEDEFPVYCPKCDYSLRGLPDGNCPECGKAFERGRLLVIQYVERACEHDFHNSPSGRRAIRVCLYGLAVSVSLALLAFGLERWPPRGNTAAIRALTLNSDTPFIILIPLLLASFVLLAHVIHHNRSTASRRRRVLRALQAGDNK